jgi:hypothetical protein
MIDLDVLLAVAGFTATALVVVGMILVTPRGAVDTLDDVTDPQGSELSRADGIDPTHPGPRPRPPVVHLGD